MNTRERLASRKNDKDTAPEFVGACCLPRAGFATDYFLVGSPPGNWRTTERFAAILASYSVAVYKVLAHKFARATEALLPGLLEPCLESAWLTAAALTLESLVALASTLCRCPQCWLGLCTTPQPLACLALRPKVASGRRVWLRTPFIIEALEQRHLLGLLSRTLYTRTSPSSDFYACLRYSESGFGYSSQPNSARWAEIS